MRRPTQKPYRHGGLSKQARREWAAALDKRAALWRRPNMLRWNVRTSSKLAFGVDLTGTCRDLSAVRLLRRETGEDGAMVWRVLAEQIDATAEKTEWSTP